MTESTVKAPALDFIDDEELRTFEGWARYQGIDVANLSEEELTMVRDLFAEMSERRANAQKVGRMKLKARPGEYRYAVAVREGDELWLALWVRRSPKPEWFVFQPRGDRDWNRHTSLHADGAFHMKSHDVKHMPQKRQPPNSIKGSEHLGAYGGHGPKTIGAVCDPADFTGVFEAPPGVLGPRNGMITVDLIEPGSGAVALEHPLEEVGRQLFTECVPNVMIRVFRS